MHPGEPSSDNPSEAGRGLEVVDTPRASEDFPPVTLARGG
jgi:hypothetical protein